MSDITERIEVLSKLLVGQEMTYEGQYGKRTKNVRGIVKAVEFAGCSITNARGEYLGIRFLIKPKGKRPVWTWAMADEWEVHECSRCGTTEGVHLQTWCVECGPTWQCSRCDQWHREDMADSDPVDVDDNL